MGLTKGQATVDGKEAPADQTMAVPVQDPAHAEGVNESWVKPEPGWMKCNVNASFIKKKQGQSLGGAVLRDHTGKAVCSAWDYIRHCQTAATGEALACRLKMALPISSTNLIVETDCTTVTEAFWEHSMDRSEVGMIAKESFLKKPPDCQVILKKVSRSCNLVAHDLVSTRA